MMELLDSLQPFWIWIAVACILLAGEALVVPTGFFLCLGTSAALVAVLLFFAPGVHWRWALALYSALTVLSGLFWWKLVRKRGRAREEDEGLLNVKTRQLIGYRAVLTEDVKGGRGRVRVNDSPWPVEADGDYPAGTLVEVVDVKGIALRVRAVEQ